jgi:hypothetical protein
MPHKPKPPRNQGGSPNRPTLNALRHGRTGQTLVLPAADLNSYERFTARFFDDFKPAGAVEEHLVQTLADGAWRLNRIRALENNLLTLGLEQQLGDISTANPEARSALAMAQALAQHTRALASLSMQEQRLSRQFESALKQIRELQAERRVSRKQDLDQAAQLLEQHRESARPGVYNPAVDGFSFSLAEIESYVSREERVHQASDAYWERRAEAA